MPKSSNQSQSRQRPLQPKLSLAQLQKQAREDAKLAHDNAVEAGKKLADAEIKLEKAEALMQEASIRLSNARKFESILKERQKKLDRAFVLLNRERTGLATQKIRITEREQLFEENITDF